MKSRSIIINFIFAAVFTSLSSCSSGIDEDYKRNPAEGGDPAGDLAYCQSLENLTFDCIDILNEETERLAAEQAAVSLAHSQIEGLIDCYDYEAAIDTQDEEAESGTCVVLVQDVLLGFDACVALSQEEKYYECSSIESATTDAVSLCDLSSAEVTTDFCALINPTTDTTI